MNVNSHDRGNDVPERHRAETSPDDLARPLVNQTHERLHATMELDEDSALLAKTIQEDSEMQRTKLEMIAIPSDDEKSFSTWMQKYTTIFTDPWDMEDEETMKARWKGGTALLYMIEGSMETENREIKRQIGIRLVYVNKSVPDAIYVPYEGIEKNFRGLQCHTRATQHSAKELTAKGYSIILNDCEDEERLEQFRDSYEGLSDNEIRQLCKRRLKIHMRNGYEFIDDPNMKYLRPASDDTQKVQAYDLLGFNIIAHPERYARYFLTDDDGRRTYITKAGFKALYIALQALDQCSEPEERSLREKFPAIDKFLTDLENSPKNEFPLYKDTVVDKK